MTQLNLAPTKIHKVFGLIDANHWSQYAPIAHPPNATIICIERLRCRCHDGPEGDEVRRIRAWCAGNLRELVYLEWKFENGFCTPVAYCVDEIDAVAFSLHWV
jgi:hypothetical protein